MNDSTLYFPTISFRSIASLKASLLVWDHVYRIVPEEHASHDDVEVQQAIDGGLVRSVALEEQDLRATAESFEAFMGGLQTIPDGFDPGADLRNVHLNKIDTRLYPVLEELAGEISDKWIALPREIARGYMLMLATVVGRRRQLTLSTDDPDAWVAASFIHEGGEFSDYVYDSEAAEQYCQLGFQDVLPLDASSLKMDRLISLSKETGPERAAFRASVSQIAEKVRACESESHVEDVVRDYRNSLSASVEALRQRYGFFRKEEAYSLLSVGVPVATSILSLILPGGTHAAPLIGGAVTIGLVGALADSRRNTPPTDQVASYLLQVQHAGATP